MKECPFCNGKNLDVSMKTGTRLGNRFWHSSVYCKDCHCYGARAMLSKSVHDNITVQEKTELYEKALQLWDKRG